MTELWAAWHPKHGFVDAYDLEGPIAFVDLDPVVERVNILNRDAGTNNRNGWRAVKVKIERVVA